LAGIRILLFAIKRPSFVPKYARPLFGLIVIAWILLVESGVLSVVKRAMMSEPSSDRTQTPLVVAIHLFPIASIKISLMCWASTNLFLIIWKLDLLSAALGLRMIETPELVPNHIVLV